ncbi:MAG: ABC transporter permease [Chitinophagaceae bacterium]|nr:ABC transporter permease [Chitinophagaceae bacterium]
MLNLLQIEWMKVKGYKAFWIFTILYFFAIVGINYTGFYINELTVQSMPASTFLLGTPYGFPKVWQTVGWMSSWLLYFPGILFIMLLTNEFNFKTHRQNIIDGWSRTQFISVKFVFAILFSVVATLFNFLVALLFGFLTTGSVFHFEGMENIGYIFIQTLAYISFAMFLAVIFRRSGVAIAVFFLFGLIFEYLITVLINYKLNLSPVGYFLPLQVTDVMLPIPFGNKVIYKDSPAVYILVIASLIYIGAYYFFSLKKFKTEDL